MLSLMYKVKSVGIISVPRFQLSTTGKSESYLKLLGYLYRNMDLERIEEHLMDKDPKFFEKIVSRALRDGKYDEAVGIINRNPFLDAWLVSKVDEQIRDILRSKNTNSSADQIPYIIQRDCFEPSSFIFPESLGAKVENEFVDTRYFHLSDHKFTLDKNVHFLDCENDKVLNDFLESVYNRKDLEVALDTEQPIYGQNGEVSLIQIASWENILLFDGIKLGQNPGLSKFVKELLENDKIQKVGHSVNSSEAHRILQIVQGERVSNLIDVRKLFLMIFPDEKKSSLKHMTKTLFDRDLCKIEQISNWSRRPLRKAQLHYAAADAFVPLLVKSKLRSLATTNLGTGFLTETIDIQ